MNTIFKSWSLVALISFSFCLQACGSGSNESTSPAHAQGSECKIGNSYPVSFTESDLQVVKKACSQGGKCFLVIAEKLKELGQVPSPESVSAIYGQTRE